MDVGKRNISESLRKTQEVFEIQNKIMKQGTGSISPEEKTKLGNAMLSEQLPMGTIKKTVGQTAGKVVQEALPKFEGAKPLEMELFRGSKGVVNKVIKNYKKILNIAGDQKDALVTFAQQGDEQANKILKNFSYTEADDFLRKKYGGDYEAIEYGNEAMPNKGKEYHDLLEGNFYSPNKEMASLYANQNRAAKYKKNPIREGMTYGKEGYNQEKVARERFNIPDLKKISSGGSDRDVYDLGDGHVLKVAKSARGLAQNRMEGEPYAPVPEAVENGLNYVVVKKVNPPDVNTKKMVSEIKKLNTWDLNNDRSPGHYEEIDKAVEVLNKYGLDGDDLRNYDVMWNDLAAVRNWGTDIDGTPIHLDAGTFNKNVIDQYKGVKNLDDEDFRQAYYQSKTAKKKYNDSDSATMYGALPPILLPKEDKEKK